jgi:phospholipase C
MANIEHIVVLMLENRSFDHLFGFYPNVDGLKGNEYNLLNPWRPESAANPRVFVGQNAAWNIVGNEGPNHSLKAVNKQLFGVGEPAAGQVATNNGFVPELPRWTFRLANP